MTAIVPIVHLLVDGRQDKIVLLSRSRPSISWRIKSSSPFSQQAYRIVAKDHAGGLLWDTGVVFSRESQGIPWEGVDLSSGSRGSVAVQLFDESGTAAPFSESVVFEVSLLENQSWGEAHWIWHDRISYDSTPPSPYFRRTFQVRSGLETARLYVTARGCFEAFLNAEKISSDYLAPGWTDFRKRIPFMTYDVTEMLKTGPNTLGAILADGWCCGNLTICRNRNVYHSHPELLARLELTYADGQRECIVSNSDWQCRTGAILSADLYDGENVDGRLRCPDWCMPGGDCHGWIPAADGGGVQPSPALVPKTAPPVRVTELLRPVRILHPDTQTSIWDFGQNFAGTYRVRVRGIKGRLYTFQTAEELKANGELYRTNYRSAKSTDSYICHGPLEQWEEFSPTFTFHGFRYLQIDGYQFDQIPPEQLEVVGLVMRSDMPVTAEFSCGNPLVTRLWKNALWSQKSNFLEIPTDCPQRDERLGWTGDAQIFAPTAMYNMDCCAFFRKYLADIRDAMTEDGASPSLAPAVIRLYDGAAGWGDAILLIPYALYRHYGCREALEENYDAMKRALLWQKVHSQGLLLTEKQFGDWLAPELTPRSLVATAYFYRCTKCLSEISGILGNAEDRETFARLAEEIRCAFRQAFLDESGVVTPCTQTALVLVLAFGLVNDEEKAANAAALQRSIRQNDNCLSTGFLGTALLPHTLVSCGLTDVAFDLVLQEKYPSWLYSVTQGATTIWEHWNGRTPEGVFADPSMNSFNHYSYGAVAGFLLNWLGGIHYTSRKLILKIIPDRRFSPVKAVYHSPYGRIASEWEFTQDGILHWEVDVPCGIPAIAQLLDGTELSLSPGHAILCKA